ncbi:MAG: glycosyltransferase family 4 protein [Leptolyngbyaceae cyanobacterium CSU_1_4]|nr:glycosyltransferase family 4 protein [Leptolyngbyaceae cyanobacterium CSU_1_4]
MSSLASVCLHPQCDPSFPIRVGFLSAHNYLDLTQWSGTLFYMQQALVQNGLQVTHLGTPKVYPTWQRKLLGYREKLKSVLVPPPFYPPIRRQWLNQVEKQICEAGCNFIVAPIASQEISLLNTSVPIVYLSDSTAKLFCQEHLYTHVPGQQSQLDRATLDKIELFEAIALTKAVHLIYPSQWAAQSAIEDYSVAPSKVSVIPFGANLEHPPSTSEVLQNRHTHSLVPCRLLFIGVDWQRKGGDVAFQTLLELLHRNINAELVVVGSVPPPHIRHEKLTVIPHLDKNCPQHRHRLNQLLQHSHFLLLPSRAECYGIALCEAGAFGLPVLTTDVGGISTIVRNGQNGYLLPLSACGLDYADRLVQILADPAHYQQLVVGARTEYDQRLNWNCWADSVQRLLLSLENRCVSSRASL